MICSGCCKETECQEECVRLNLDSWDRLEDLKTSLKVLRYMGEEDFWSALSRSIVISSIDREELDDYYFDLKRKEELGVTQVSR